MEKIQNFKIRVFLKEFNHYAKMLNTGGFYNEKGGLVVYDNLTFSNRENDLYKAELSLNIFDKNNKEIYEGDIIKIEQGGKSVVKEVNIDECTKDFSIKDFLTRKSNNVEIIGNIHENADLLDCESCKARLHIELELKVKSAPAGDSSFTWVKRKGYG